MNATSVSEWTLVLLSTVLKKTVYNSLLLPEISGRCYKQECTPRLSFHSPSRPFFVRASIEITLD